MNNFYKAIIVDDEADGRLVLSNLLSTYCPEVKLLQQCKSANEGVLAIDTFSPDIVFLDINMPRINGFSMLEKVKEKDFDLIFVTAHHDYAIKAIRYSALDYLLKPIDPEELVAAIQRCAFNKSQNAEKRSHFMANVTNEEIKQIVLPVRDGYVFVKIDDIVHCEADSNYTVLYLANGEKYMVSKTLKDFEHQLSNKKFFRIHKSHLVNIDYLKKYTKGDGGTVTLLDNTNLDVSRRNKEEFLKIFNG